MKKISLLFLITAALLMSCSSDDPETGVIDPQTIDPLVGVWKGSGRVGEKSALLNINIENPASGTGDVRFVQNSETQGNYSVEYTGKAIIQSVRSQIQITLNSDLSDDYATYNGSLDKSDTTKYQGNLSLFDSATENKYSINLELKKQ